MILSWTRHHFLTMWILSVLKIKPIFIFAIVDIFTKSCQNLYHVSITQHLNLINYSHWLTRFFNELKQKHSIMWVFSSQVKTIFSCCYSFCFFKISPAVLYGNQYSYHLNATYERRIWIWWMITNSNCIHLGHMRQI